MPDTFQCAGHTFDRYTDRCIGTKMTADGPMICGTRWLDIHDVDQSCVGKPGWAHVNNLGSDYLSQGEYAQIEKERERRARVFWEATQNRASVESTPAAVDTDIAWGYVG